jgi:segregation and condensation protein B
VRIGTTVRRGPLLRRDPSRLPENHPRSPLYWLDADAPAEQAAAGGELARDAKLAHVEAALIAADEPLTARRLAQAAALADGSEARKLVKRLQALYDLDATAFRVEEIAGGYQLLTRP